jgi:UDP-N-acetylmuramoylalanine--D-glutamate ligase
MLPATLSSRPPVNEWTDRHVTLMGLGRHGGGLGAARFLADQGARVTISDAAEAPSLSAEVEALADLPIQTMHFGGHDERDFRSAEVVVVNPAVRPDHPCLRIAREAGARLTSEIELFLERCPARVIGVSGSNGKSTTATMLAEILRSDGRRTWLGGNIGGSLLDQLDQVRAGDWVVLELSSFQLAHLNAAARLPEISVITNCTPNHLDWHGTFTDYAAAKRRLLGCPAVVLNADDPLTGSWRVACSGHLHAGRDLRRIPNLLIPGQHNRQNAACAAAAAELAGVAEQTIARALAGFRGLEHRIEWVADVNGRRFYNDSKATSPSATMAALAAIGGPVWLLAGGVAKGTSFDDLAAAVVARTRGIAVFGQAGESLRSSIHARDANHPAHACETLAAALPWCVERSSTGDAILLSPACASFDQFDSFEDRGRQYVEMVRQLN